MSTYPMGSGRLAVALVSLLAAWLGCAGCGEQTKTCAEGEIGAAKAHLEAVCARGAYAPLRPGVSPPEAPLAAVETPPHGVLLQISAGETRLQERLVGDAKGAIKTIALELLARRSKVPASEGKQPPIVVLADRGEPVERVAQALRELAEAGFGEVWLAFAVQGALDGIPDAPRADEVAEHLTALRAEADQILAKRRTLPKPGETQLGKLVEGARQACPAIQAALAGLQDVDPAQRCATVSTNLMDAVEGCDCKADVAALIAAATLVGGDPAHRPGSFKRVVLNPRSLRPVKVAKGSSWGDAASAVLAGDDQAFWLTVSL